MLGVWTVSFVFLGFFHVMGPAFLRFDGYPVLLSLLWFLPVQTGANFKFSVPWTHGTAGLMARKERRGESLRGSRQQHLHYCSLSLW